MSFLQLEDKTIIIFGVANRKSVAYHIGETITQAGAKPVYVVRSEIRKEQLQNLLGDFPIYVCDVEHPEQIKALYEQLRTNHPEIHGIVHSIAFADYEEGPKPFHETAKKQFLRAFDISCYSFIAIANTLKDLLVQDASVITISISTTTMASENYGFMAPVKAALDSSLAFLTKSFSNFSKVRFNAVGPSLLKTSASAGIPGYVDSYLFAEKVIPRKQALQTQEAANVAAFLLSPRSSGICAQTVVVDAGMRINYFDNEVIRNTLSEE
ncbi:MAG: enoyl-ACP reductase [Planctomycetaceae bacterium]|nr:enoyl-ACP reductase [Planctomycetaceae bacterium]